MDLTDLRVMVVNDDGYQGPGIAILAEAARRIFDDVWTVAPLTNQTAKSRSYSICREVAVQRVDERVFAVDGTPVDCAIVGLNGLLPGRRPDLVISGVNEGENAGEEIPMSGTVAACLEAVDQNVPAIAFSQAGAYHSDDPAGWTASRTHLPVLLPRLVNCLGNSVSMLNVNFPNEKEPGDHKGIRVAPVGKRAGPVTIEKRSQHDDGSAVFFYDQLRPNQTDIVDCDIDLLNQGYITVTPLSGNLTDIQAMDTVRDRIS